MALPSESDLLKHLAKNPRDPQSLRDLVHHFDVTKTQERDFMYWLDGLATARRIQRVKAKTYQAAPNEKGGRSDDASRRQSLERFARDNSGRSQRFGRDTGPSRGGAGGAAGRGKFDNKRGGKPGGDRPGSRFGGGAGDRGGKFGSAGGAGKFGGNAGGNKFGGERGGAGKGAFARGPERRGAGPKAEGDSKRGGKNAIPPKPATQIVGTIMQLSPPMARVTTDDFEATLPVQGALQGVAVGDAAVFIKHEARDGEHLELELALGDPKHPRVTVYDLATRHAFYAKFTEAAERLSHTMARPGPEHLGPDRIDIRDLPLVTIDGEDAKDFDDAVYAERQGNGFRLVVAIADVSAYVKPGSLLDEEGLARGTSVYFPGFVLPMLPHALSDDLCSLRPDQDRLCFVADMQIDAEGQIAKSRSYRGLMRSRARLTYGQVEAAVNKGEHNAAHAVGQPLIDFTACSRLLRKAKERRGALDLDMAEGMVLLGPDGFPVDSVRRSRFESHRLIEDAMLAANTAIARETKDRGLPVPYRVHDQPSVQKLELLIRMVATMGNHIRLELPPKPKQLAQFVEALAKLPRGNLLFTYVLRALARAEYKAEPLGHYALAEPDYLHFTSPIRRFPDLLTHRSLGSNGKDVPKRLDLVCTSLSERERAAELASRSVNDYYRCLLAKPLIGEEMEATVNSVLDFGAFVETDKPYLEGLLPVRAMGNDYFELDDTMTRLSAGRAGKSIGIGDRVKVKIREVRMSKRQIEFELVQPGGAAAQPRGNYRGRRS